MLVYAMLFRTVAETLRTIAADPRHLGAEIGLIAVLTDWGQNLHFRPHIHCIVPGGGVSPDGSRWISCRPGFFLPVRVLSRLFPRRLLEELRAAFDAHSSSSSATLPARPSQPPSPAWWPRRAASTGWCTPNRRSAVQSR
ncbi:MAG: transposase [Hyphomicrobium sp.]